jgi:hypothetical protein
MKKKNSRENGAGLLEYLLGVHAVVFPILAAGTYLVLSIAAASKLR